MEEGLKNKGKNVTTYLLQGIPIHAYRIFQSKCALQGKKMKEVLIDFIEGYGE